jgi:very-short-patch-repair endonuclease
MKSRAGELRRNQTPAERELWKRLRLRQVDGVRFLRQYIVGSCILDFYAPSIRLAVELDGGQHYEANAHKHDDARSRWLASRGIEVLRYPNLDVSRRIDDVLDDILRTVARLKAHPPAPAARPPSCGRG